MCSAFCGPLVARGGIASIGEVLCTGLPSETCVNQERPGPWLTPPFRECVVFSLGDPNVSCGGSFAGAFCKCDPNVSVRRIEASFRKRNFSESTLASLAVVLGTYTCRHGYWHCVITPGLQVSWHEFVCMARSVLVSSVRRLVRRCWLLLCSRFHFSS